MRALLTILLVFTGGCDIWWSSFISNGTPTADAGIDAPADLASEEVPDLQVSGCTSSTMCKQLTGQACDRNTGICSMYLLDFEPFPDYFATSIPLNQRYVLMASGDYNGDQVTDVAVSGLFTGGTGANATAVATTNVDIYLGDGAGGLTFDGSCGVNDKVTYLLTVPATAATSKTTELLVATYGPQISHCMRNAGGGWSVTSSTLSINGSGFKQLALAYDTNSAFPNLVVRTSKNLFPEPTGSGALDIHRMKSGYSITSVIAEFSSSDISWVSVTPYHFGQTNADTLALSWDSKPPINFEYLNNMLMAIDQGNAQPPISGGTPFPELSLPLRTSALLRMAGKPLPYLVTAVSQSKNQVSLQYGATVASFAVIDSLAVSANGLMLAYTGDLNEDGQDELGIYTIAPNLVASTRSLQLYTLSNGLFNTAPMIDLSFATENVRGMAFGYLGALGNRRRLLKRKDLITLVEDPGGMSRLIIRRPNLNYEFPE